MPVTDVITCDELHELGRLFPNVKVMTKDPAPGFHAWTNSQKHHGHGNIFVKSSSGDYDDLSDLDLDAELFFFRTSGRMQNYYIYVSCQDVSPGIKEKYKDILSVHVVPSIYSWYERKKTIAELTDINFRCKNIKKHFLCLNNRASWYRQSLFYLFVTKNLLDKSYFSYLLTGRYGETSDDLYRTHHEDFWFTKDLDHQYLMALLPLRTDLESSPINAFGDWSYGNVKYYTDTFCSIVTETYNFEQSFFTEKIFKCFKYYQPFLVYGGHNSVAALKNLGFECFDDIFDLAYDQEFHPIIRFEKLVDEILKIANYPIDHLQDLHHAMVERLQHNYDHFTSVLPQIYDRTMRSLLSEISIKIKRVEQHLV